jgi:DNA-binding NarL/FixJ family response regulator
MPLLDGIQTTRLLKARWPAIAIVVLSMDAGQQSVALAAGADAFVSKTEEPHEVLKALQRACGPGSTGANTTGDLARRNPCENQRSNSP